MRTDVEANKPRGPLVRTGLFLDTKITVTLVFLSMGSIILWALNGSDLSKIVAARAFVYGIALVGLGVAWSYGGLFVLGQGVFFGAGAYFYAIIAKENVLVNVPAVMGSVIFSVFICVILVIPLLWRLKGIYFAVSLLVLSFMAEQLVLSLPFTGEFNGISNVPPLVIKLGVIQLTTDKALHSLIIAAVGLFIVYLIALIVVSSRFGTILSLIREDAVLANQLGFRPVIFWSIAMMLNAAIAGFSGALYASIDSAVFPKFAGFETSGRMVVWLVLGGVGTIGGPVLGAVFFNLAQSLLGPKLLSRWILFQGASLVFIAKFFKTGILGGFMSFLKTRKSNGLGTW